MVSLYNETEHDIDYNEVEIESWVTSNLEKEGFNTGIIEIILLSDEDITKVNIEFLGHHYPTDVITFTQEKKNSLSGSVYIGIETVVKNSILHNVSVKNELYRVVIHGMLHLAGYNDLTEEERRVMREKEDYYLEEIFR